MIIHPQAHPQRPFLPPDALAPQAAQAAGQAMAQAAQNVGHAMSPTAGAALSVNQQTDTVAVRWTAPASAPERSRYVVQRKFHTLELGLTDASASMSPSGRAQQIAVLNQRIARAEIVERFRSSARAVLQDPALPIGNVQPVTGSLTLYMTPEEAQDMANQNPDMEVVLDFRISLIQPVPTAAPSPQDLFWHVRHVQAHRAHRQWTGEGVTVAVLDTGIDANHEELGGRVRRGVRFQGRNPVDETPSTDSTQHGTHVAGILAGNQAGIAPGSMLVSVKMIPGGRGWFSDFIAAMEWAALQPEVAIVNLSAGFPGYEPSMLRSIENLRNVGILPVVAIGNEGHGRTRSPGNYSISLSVGATDRNNAAAVFSGGAQMVVDSHIYTVPNLVAPGVGIRSCVPGGDYETFKGTSMATPIVSGIAALLLQQQPQLSVLELERALLDGCTDLGLLPTFQGRGLIDVAKAMKLPD